MWPAGHRLGTTDLILEKLLRVIVNTVKNNEAANVLFNLSEHSTTK